MKNVLKLILTVSVCLFFIVSCGTDQESEDKAVTKSERTEELICTLSVNCKTALGKCGEKNDILPDDGMICEQEQVVFIEGETVFDILKRHMRDKKIHLEYSLTPVYDNAYIEGIGNLYEFDCGELSGWMFKVNGEFPAVGCSDVTVSEGDCIEFVYSCDMGRDIGKSTDFSS